MNCDGNPSTQEVSVVRPKGDDMTFGDLLNEVALKRHFNVNDYELHIDHLGGRIELEWRVSDVPVRQVSCIPSTWATAYGGRLWADNVQMQDYIANSTGKSGDILVEEPYDQYTTNPSVEWVKFANLFDPLFMARQLTAIDHATFRRMPFSELRRMVSDHPEHDMYTHIYLNIYMYIYI